MACMCYAIIWAESFANLATLVYYGTVDAWSSNPFFLIMLHLWLPFLGVAFLIFLFRIKFFVAQRTAQGDRMPLILPAQYECVNKFCYFLIADIESIFTIICNLVTKTENTDEAMEIVKVITAKIVQQPNEKPAVRLKM